jgi:NAD(P)-dependent dehydrogenase (short-subunit alcohol dehydrogenase family)
MQNWTTGKSYCLAKLCNILFTRELARRIASDGIVVNAMHPGVIASNFSSHADIQMQDYLAKQPSLSPEIGADTLVWLATAPEAGCVTGAYFYERKAVAPGRAALDDTAARRLWTESEILVATSGYSPKA